MTKNRIRYGLILVFSALLFLFYHNFFFFYLLAVVVLLPAISYFISRNVWNSLSVTPDIKLYSVGTDNRIPVEFTVSNSSMFPVQGVKAEFIVENRFYPNEEVQEITLPVRRNENVYGWNMESVYAGYVGLQGRKLTMQDYLGLDNSARINQPSTHGSNWKWRVDPEDLSPALAERIRRLTVLFGR